MIIDFDTHPFMIQEIFTGDGQLERAVKEVFGLHFPAQPLSIILKEMDAAGVDKTVVLPTDCTTSHSVKLGTNKAIADLITDNPRLIGFASVDPRSKKPVKDLRHAILELNLRGLNLDPALQGFEMSSIDYAYPLYAECAELDIPVMVQCGLNWAPKALLRDGNPLDLEPAIAQHPNTNFVISHLGWPWVNEATSLAMKYSNVFLDTSVVYSGTPTECLDHVINNILGKHLFERNLVEQVVYGSGYPRADMRRTMRGIKSLGFNEDFSDNLFYKTAHKLLGMKAL